MAARPSGAGQRAVAGSPATGSVAPSLRRLEGAAPLGARARAHDADDELIVRAAAGVGRDDVREAVLRHGGAVAGGVRRTGYVVVRAPPARLRAAAAALRAEPAIAAVERNHLRRAAAAPDDLLYREGWNQRAHLGIVRLPSAWDAAKGSESVRIAVLDTGVDLDHPDLAPVLGEGFDAVEGDGVPDDDDGHGTFVAGVAAAATNNDRGVAGAAWRATVMPVKVLGADGYGTDADIAEGITWATDHGADVINLSFDGPEDGDVLRAAVGYARAHDVVVVAAAGNEGREAPSYPAAYEGVLAVSATSSSGDVTWYSNRGDWVDVAAPGHDLAGTAPVAGPAERYGLLSDLGGGGDREWRRGARTRA